MRIIETSAQDDLTLFSRLLWQQQIAHRVFEERGVQVLELRDAQHAETVRRWYGAWQSGEMRLTPVAADIVEAPASPGLLSHALRLPVVTAAVLLSLLCLPFSLPAAEGVFGSFVRMLLIADPMSLPADAGVPDFLPVAEIWRWLTPTFLHFSVLHIAFNAVIWIELGRRVEREEGSARLALLLVALSLLANLAQVVTGGSPVFGGLSGVVYGVLGYIVIRGRRAPHVAQWRLPPGVALSLLIFLVFFSTGITEAFGLYVANAAHWGGLLGGIALGWILPQRAVNP